MNISYDLHIHSCLSPCGDNDMTPNNIINMSKLKGLDIISVTDHNSAKNLPALFECAKELGNKPMIIAGLEIASIEDVHLLAYFKTLDKALEIGEYIYKYLPDIKNQPSLFGEQRILDSGDNLIDNESKLLISPVNLTMEKIKSAVEELGGVLIPAHVNKKSFSIISSLGFIDQTLNFKALEVHGSAEDFKTAFPHYKDYLLFTNSDAHYLENISEPQNFIHEDFFKMLNS